MVVRRALTDYTRAPRDMIVNLRYTKTDYVMTIPNGFASIIDKIQPLDTIWSAHGTYIAQWQLWKMLSFRIRFIFNGRNYTFTT